MRSQSKLQNVFVYTQIEVQFAVLKDSNEALFCVFGRTVHFVKLLYERHVFNLKFVVGLALN